MISAAAGFGDAESLRLAFVVGVAVSMLVRERWHLATGSVVVPGYLAAAAGSPAALAVTAVVAGLCHVAVDRAVASRVIIDRRTRFVLLALVSISLTAAASQIAAPGGALGPWASLADTAGFLVPALIAHDLGRQGVARTVRGVVAATAGVVALLALASLVVTRGGTSVPDVDGGFGFAFDMLPFAVLVGAAVAGLLQRWFGLRAGGFVGGAYLALLSADWRSVAVVVAIAAVTHLVVTRAVAPASILFGRRKFAAMLLTGGLLGWAAVSSGSIPVGPGLAGLAIVPLLLPALIANDIERVGPARTMAGLAVSTGAVLVAVRSVAAGGALAQLGSIAIVSTVLAGVVLVHLAAVASSARRSPERAAVAAVA